MIDWKKRKEEIENLSIDVDDSTFTFYKSAIDEIITQEQSMIEKLEADKTESEKELDRIKKELSTTRDIAFSNDEQYW
jgi:hypothetical protein